MKSWTSERSESRFIRSFLATLLLVVMHGQFVNAQSQAPTQPVDSAVTIEVEAESFQFTGSWKPFSEGSRMGLSADMGAKQDAMTAIQVPQAGDYFLWVLSRDFPHDRPGIRRYRLLIDGTPVEKEAGAHGHDGWYWEQVGKMTLGAGEHLLSLHDTTRMFGRCDAILLTTSSMDPNKQSSSDLAKYRTTPLKIETRTKERLAATAIPPVDAGSFKQVATIANDSSRINFLEGKDASGQPRILRRTELKINGQWRPLPLDGAGETLWLIYSPQTKLSVMSYWPAWSRDVAFSVAGRQWNTVAWDRDPFMAGDVQPLVARSSRIVDARTVEVTYVALKSGLRATGRWTAPPDHEAVHLKLSFTADKPGDYSIAFGAFAGWDQDAISQVFLPPMYQYQRLPKSPELITSSQTPHALAMIQTTLASQSNLGGPFTFSVIADPQKLPFRWATSTNAPYGFSLLNEQNKAQPVIFSPVLGMDGSAMKVGEKKEVGWYVLAKAGDWMKTLEQVSQGLFKVSDYRQPVGASLTDAALNVFDLLRNTEASGWNARLKGFYNIEIPDGVTQAAPLAVLEAAILSHDEKLYVDRALPTIEYTLSRSAPHFTLPDMADGQYVKPADTQLRIPSTLYGAAYWQGVDQLLGRANPWIAQLIFDSKGKPKRTNAKQIPEFSPLLAEYRLHPTPQLLEQVKQAADRYLQTDVYSRQTSSITDTWAFYNVSFYPYWWELPDLYELTGDKRYLDAAVLGAFYTISGQWAQPQIPTGDITIHSNGQFMGESKLWWKGGKPYRLGYPRHAEDTPQKQIPAWEASQVGLGLEEPATYFTSSGPMRNITMSNWAPHLLRVYGQTKREIFRTYARNAIIGRFANYPGYYIRGYTDLYQSPDYPIKGPDVTSIYYHHIPPMLEFAIDFLLTEADVRSDGKVQFPWVRQEGYVWFTNRIYGAGPGKVFDDPRVELYLSRKGIHVDSKDVNYLIGRGRNRLWLILMNDAHQDVTAPIQLDAKAYGIQTDQPYTIVDAGGKTLRSEPFADTLRPDVPAGGLIAVSFPTAIAEVSPAIVPLRGGRLEQKLGGDWGTLHAFRIRGPFGHDALYVVMDGRPQPGSRAELFMGDEAKPLAATNQYPYEFSIYPWSMDRDMAFHVVLHEAGGGQSQSKAMTLEGTAAEK